MTTARLEIPAQLIPVFTAPDKRYRCAWGGRGSGKTRTFALMTAVRGYQLAEAGESGIILCLREYMNSLDDSSLEEIKEAINSVEWLRDYYEIGEKYVRSKNRRIRYSFAGLNRNLNSIKSKAKILLAWIDEAESVSEIAYQKLLPTIREEGSECWVTWNPELDGSPTDERFRKSPPEECITVECNYWHNEFFPDVLEIERQSDLRRLDPQTYAWIWEGDYLENSDKQVLSGKYEIADFDPARDWDGPYYGLDWGFANDPTAAVKCWVHDECLYIEQEAGKTSLELDETGDYVREAMPGIERHTVRADCARPESISYVKRASNGLPRIEAAPKWSGSVDDGVAHLRSYRRIYIHPRCTETAREARMYSYKVDRLTGDIKPDIDDKFNHYMDACIEHGQAVDTAEGPVEIQNVVHGDMVMTRKGYRRVLVSRMTHARAKIYEVQTSGGLSLRGTQDHLVYTKERGFVRIDALRYNDTLVINPEGGACKGSISQRQSSTEATPGGDILPQREGLTGSISSDQGDTGTPSSFIGRCGKIILGQSPSDGMCTTGTRIARTTTRETLSACRIPTTWRNMVTGMAASMNAFKTSIESGHYRRLGTLRQRVFRSIEKLAPWLTRTLPQSQSRAGIAGRSSALKPLGTGTSFVPMPASLHGDGRQALTTFQGIASDAGENGESTNTPKPGFAQDTVLSITDTGDDSPVYDLMVEDAEEFFASGILVHNCRYALAPLIKAGNQAGVFLRKRHR